MRIYLIRNADPDYLNDSITPSGHEQALVLAQYLQTLQINEIYSSPLGRTQMTASYTADLLRLPILTENWLRELDDLWIEDLDRASVGDATIAETVKQNSLLAGGSGRFYQPDPCLMEENMGMIQRGSDHFLRRQGFHHQEELYRVSGENRKSIAVFTHMGVGLVWLSYLLDIPITVMWSGFYLFPASITTILMDERVPGYAIPRCLGLGDISHLGTSGCHPHPIGIFANQD